MPSIRQWATRANSRFRGRVTYANSAAMVAVGFVFWLFGQITAVDFLYAIFFACGFAGLRRATQAPVLQGDKPMGFLDYVRDKFGAISQIMVVLQVVAALGQLAATFETTREGFRAWLFEALGHADKAADITATEFDDNLVATLQTLVGDDACYGVIFSLVQLVWNDEDNEAVVQARMVTAADELATNTGLGMPMVLQALSIIITLLRLRMGK